MELLHHTGKPVWCYTVGRRLLPPYANYRLALWQAFRLGATGCGFWCYAVGRDWQNTDMWHESGWGYPVIYTLEGAPEEISRQEAIIPSKRWEAWREGIEDYTYLYLLQELIESSPPSESVTEARHLLATAVQEVLDDPADLTRADRHRQKILEALRGL